MVLMSVVDGNTHIVRNVHMGKFQRHVEGFFALRKYHKNGKLYQLIGKERRLLRTFGTMEIK